MLKKIAANNFPLQVKDDIQTPVFCSQTETSDLSLECVWRNRMRDIQF
jgi:hypothetical protein